MSTYSVVDVAEIEPAGPGGVVRFVRRELGIGAFGLNHFTLPQWNQRRTKLRAKNRRFAGRSARRRMR